jgi:hypothetical protein
MQGELLECYLQINVFASSTKDQLVEDIMGWSAFSLHDDNQRSLAGRCIHFSIQMITAQYWSRRSRIGWYAQHLYIVGNPGTAHDPFCNDFKAI